MSAAIHQGWFRFSLRSLFLLVTAVAVIVVSFASMKRWVTMGVISPALVRVRYQAPDLLADGSASTSRAKDFEAYLNSQVTLIKSTFVLQAALRSSKVAGLPIVKQNKMNAVGWMQEFLQVEVVGDSEIIQISFNDGSAYDRVAITNQIVEAYMEESVNAQHAERLRHREILERLYRKSLEEWQQKSVKIRELTKEFGHESIYVEVLRLELDVLTDLLKQLGIRMKIIQINLDSLPRVQFVEHATAK